jgi:hypothetical protein
MSLDKHLIITSEGLEKTVYSIYNHNLNNLLKITFLEIFLLKDIQSPKVQKFQSVINSPIKILKNKSNLKLQTSVIVSINEFIFECKTQIPCNLHNQSLWNPLCEDIIELNIKHKILDNINLSVFAIKNLIDNKHYYFADIKTIQKIKQLFFILSYFLEENHIKKSFTTIYKKIINNTSIEDILESFKNKQYLLDNHLFLITCISEYKQPDILLASFLQNKILPQHWTSGESFFKEFSNYIAIPSEHIKETIINTYDKFLLYMKLNNNLTCQNKVKCAKI